ncbi:hypothetical protein SNOG_08974 [Parastagonospora nodorum SN15]|uniref:Uncharacterized protein n=1 Tax=Phaeosphaeria nodorum (strain SN15 / ATCC MYA-4574 / FGSC 10173) TaxID=321614 RepID=Q0UGZ0_PHANO|nr:hypothetical protein SNOG_08974 [Parastagonospora nodorum SN15]EAT84142.1 hypothetical protein SNOG_08974 [Parastagonospora nodorum SN15]
MPPRTITPVWLSIHTLKPSQARLVFDLSPLASPCVYSVKRDVGVCNLGSTAKTVICNVVEVLVMERLDDTGCLETIAEPLLWMDDDIIDRVQ